MAMESRDSDSIVAGVTAVSLEHGSGYTQTS